MLRIIILLLKLLLVAGVTWFLVRYPGTVDITWQGKIISVSLGVAVVVALLVGLIVTFLLGGLRFLQNIPDALFRKRRWSRQQKGLTALSQGLVAIASGDAKMAQKQASKVRGLLDKPGLSLLVSAQAEQLAGNTEKAGDYYEKMLDEKDVQLLGVRGLITQACNKGEIHKALRLATETAKVNPNAPWLIKETLHLQEEVGDWLGALETLEDALRRKIIKPEEGKKKKIEFLTIQIGKERNEGNIKMALKRAEYALKLAPENPKVVNLTAQLYKEDGQDKKALKVVEVGYKMTPSRDLISLYEELCQGKTPEARVKQIKRLVSGRMDAFESVMALARVNLDARKWDKARGYLMQLEKEKPTSQVYRMLAELEQVEHNDDQAAKQWLEKATVSYDATFYNEKGEAVDVRKVEDKSSSHT